MRQVRFADVKDGDYVYLSERQYGFPPGPYKVTSATLFYLESDEGQILQMAADTTLYVKDEGIHYIVTRTVFKGDNLFSGVVLNTTDKEKATAYIEERKLKRIKEGLAIHYETERSVYLKRVGSPFHMLYNLYEI